MVDKLDGGEVDDCDRHVSGDRSPDRLVPSAIPMDRDHTPGRIGGHADRGQSVFDFAIGISLFLVVVVAVLVTIPTAFGALDRDAGTEPSDDVAAERVADYLVQTAFANPGQSGRLKSECVQNFFYQDLPGTSWPEPPCSYDFDERSVRDRVGLNSTSVSVSIRSEYAVLSAGPEQMCWDGTDPDPSQEPTNSYVRASSSDCTPEADGDFLLQAGAPPSDNDDYETARRVATLADRTVYVVVRTW
jgi:hypothetical protein